MGAVEGIGAVTGLHAEAVLARRLGMRAACCGPTPARAEDLAADLVEDQGVIALVSFGLCGGLAPWLTPGTLVVADTVLTEDEAPYPTDADWRRALLDRLPGAVTGPVLGLERVVTSVAEKADLFAETGALAVDTESTGVAAAAARAGVPFLVLRAVADTAGEALPRAALVGVKDDGRVAVGAALAATLRHPAEIPLLIRTARASRAAMKALLRGGALLGPTLP